MGQKTTQNGTGQNALTCQLCSFLLCLLAVSYLGNFAVPLDLGIWYHPDTPTRGFILKGFLSKAFFERLYACGVNIFIPIVITMVVSMGPHLLRSGRHIQRTVFMWTCASPRMGSVVPSDPGTSQWCARHLHRHLPLPFFFFPEAICLVCGGVVEVSVWGGSGHLRDIVVASVTLLLSADLGTALFLVVWPLL